MDFMLQSKLAVVLYGISLAARAIFISVISDTYGMLLYSIKIKITIDRCKEYGGANRRNSFDIINHEFWSWIRELN